MSSGQGFNPVFAGDFGLVLRAVRPAPFQPRRLIQRREAISSGAGCHARLLVGNRTCRGTARGSAKISGGDLALRKVNRTSAAAGIVPGAWRSLLVYG